VHLRSRGRLIAITLTALFATALPARAQHVSEVAFLSAVNGMLADLAPTSLRSAIAIRETYRPFLDLLALNDFGQIQEGLDTGGLVPLPSDPEHLNVRVRLEDHGRSFTPNEHSIALEPKLFGQTDGLAPAGLKHAGTLDGHDTYQGMYHWVSAQAGRSSPNLDR